jgi:hypothetical protein
MTNSQQPKEFYPRDKQLKILAGEYEMTDKTPITEESEIY